MRIVSLEAENYKRLKAVEITPEGDTIVIGGRNAQGKSSVLDAIWAALGGRDGNKTSKPIRDGEKKAKVRLDLGDMIVTRTWTGDNSTVKVESAEGAQFKSPQALLDGLVGKLSFDPLAFTRLSPREQREALLGLVHLDVDLDLIDQTRETLFAKRTDVGREGKALGEVTVDPDLPTTEQSASAILTEIREIQEANRAREAGDRDVDYYANLAQQTSAEIARLTKLLTEQEQEHAAAQSRRAEFPEPRPVDELEEQLTTIESTNAAIRTNNEARATKERQDKLRADYEALTVKITALDTEKQDALATADFPVEGLGFDAHGVTFQGVPFGQASSAEQIRVSLAMAIAANPKLRVVRIMDGSLLDTDSMGLIAGVAADNDFQVWIEKVGADGVGVVIEDGQIAGQADAA